MKTRCNQSMLLSLCMLLIFPAINGFMPTLLPSAHSKQAYRKSHIAPQTLLATKVFKTRQFGLSPRQWSFGVRFPDTEDDTTLSWNELEDIFRKYDTTDSEVIFLNETIEAFKDAGLEFDDEMVTAILDEEGWGGETVSLVRFQYLFERLRALSDPEAVDEMSARVRKGTLAKFVRLSDRRKEAGRRLRRTVFVESDWRKYRSSYRLVDNLATIAGKNSVVRGVWLEVSMVFSATCAVMGWNAAVVSGLIDSLIPPMWNFHLSPLALPAFPFVICSGALGLLLVFRTDWAYARYRDARGLWGDTADICKRLLSEGDIAFPNTKVRDALYRRIVAFSLVLKKRVRGGKVEEAFLIKELTALLGEDHANRILGAQNRPYMALHEIAQLLGEQREMAEAAGAGIQAARLGAMEGEVQQLVSKVGAMERIYHGPTPLAYTRFTGRYLALWTLMVPFGLWNELKGSLIMLPVATIIAVFFFGIEELGTQIEEPFSLLPLEWICEGIESVAAELVRKRGKYTATPDHEIVGHVRSLRSSDQLF